MMIELSSLLLSYSSFFFFFIFCLILLLLFNSKPTQPSNFTPLRSYPIIHNLPHYISNGHRILHWATELVSLSPTATATVSPHVFTSNPSNIEHVLRSNFLNYPKGDAVIAILHDFLGHGIFNANGDLWRLQRKIASFEFNTKSIRAFIMDTVSREAASSLVPVLADAAATGAVVDLQDVLERFAFDNVCSLVFGHNPRCLVGGGEGIVFFRAFEEVAHLSIERMEHALNILWKIKRWLNVGSERRLRESARIVHEIAGKFAALRRREGGDDLISRFAADDTIPEELLRDILISFVLAGRDTTPSALTWFFWVLSSNPKIVRKISEEIASIRAKTDKRYEPFSLDELKNMNYLHAAISESMRLYPPVPLVVRSATEDDVLPDGTVVKKGWSLMYNSYAMGRMESIWGKDCMEMKPQRWLEDGVYRPTSPFKYPVFHAGPRMCLGKEMAYIQMKAVAACVLEMFDVEVAEKRGEPQLSITMRMKDGLPLRIKQRNACAQGV